MLSRSLKGAREAYKNKSVEETRRAHEAAKPPEEHRQEQGKYLKSVVYGGLDGIITTFAVVAGVAGAELGTSIILILGFANLIADGLSMAVGDYLSTKAEQEYGRAERAREAWEVQHYPEGERRELVELYTSKGMSEHDASALVDILARHPQTWVDVMMVEELGILESDESPFRNGVATFLSFGLFGFIPLVAFIASKFSNGMQRGEFMVACGLTAVTLFALGTLKSRFTRRGWVFSGLETFLVGGLAAAAAYGTGALLSSLVGGGAH